MCMTFGYNPQINFCHFFHSLNCFISIHIYETLTISNISIIQTLIRKRERKKERKKRKEKKRKERKKERHKVRKTNREKEYINTNSY